jgi:hypothetical protein
MLMLGAHGQDDPDLLVILLFRVFPISFVTLLDIWISQLILGN